MHGSITMSRYPLFLAVKELGKIMCDWTHVSHHSKLNQCTYFPVSACCGSRSLTVCQSICFHMNPKLGRSGSIDA